MVSNNLSEDTTTSPNTSGAKWTKTAIFLISNFRRVLNLVCILLGISPASDCCMPQYNNQTPGKYPKEYIQDCNFHFSIYKILFQETAVFKSRVRQTPEFSKSYIRFLKINFIRFYLHHAKTKTKGPQQ